MKNTIRWQLIVVLSTIIVISLISITAFMQYFQVDDYQHNVQKTDAAFADTMAHSVTESLRYYMTVNEMIASRENLTEMSEKEQRQYLRRATSLSSRYELLAVVDMNGMQVARSSGVNGDRRDRDWYKAFSLTHQNGISPVYYSATSHNLIVTFTSAVREESQLKGMLMADLSVENIIRFIHRSVENDSRKVLLLDSSGKAVVHFDDDTSSGMYNYRTMEKTVYNWAAKSEGTAKFVRESFNVSASEKDILDRAMNGESGSGRFKDSNNNSYFCVYRPVGLPTSDKPWTIIVVRSYDELLTPAIDGIMRGIVACLLVMVFAAVFCVAYARRITDSIEAFAKAAEKLGQGDYTVRMREDGIAQELVSIAVNFNNMAGKLKTLAAEKEKDAERISELAYHDNLTGLLNRTYYMDFLTRLLRDAARDGRHGVLFFIDVDHFKSVNDNYGHAAGDKLLCEVGHRLVTEAGRRDLVCRYGGDEFLVVLPGGNEIDAEDFAKRVIASLSRPFIIDDITVNVSGSAGWAYYPDDALDRDTLLSKADDALYYSKNNGKNRAVHYEAGMENGEREKR